MQPRPDISVLFICLLVAASLPSLQLNDPTSQLNSKGGSRISQLTKEGDPACRKALQASRRRGWWFRPPHRSVRL